VSKCEHGYTDCSECGAEKTRAHSGIDLITTEDRFNNYCATVLGYKSSYRHRTHVWLDGVEEIIKSNFNPHKNHEQLIVVVQQIINERKHDR